LPGGTGVKGRSLHLHRARLGTHRVKAQRLVQPHGFAGIEPRHMFAPDQRNHLSEPHLMQLDQLAAVFILFTGHAIENRGRGRVFDPQAFRIKAIDAGIVLFRGNRQGQNLLFCEVRKSAARGYGGQHGKTPKRLCPTKGLSSENEKGRTAPHHQPALK
jgi:hypothetical protein